MKSAKSLPNMKMTFQNALIAVTAHYLDGVVRGKESNVIAVKIAIKHSALSLEQAYLE
jgi:hypothetical protein